MTRWCGSVKPQGSRSLLTGGWRMERTWILLRWDPPSTCISFELKIQFSFQGEKCDSSSGTDVSCILCCCCRLWMKNGSYHLLHFQSFIVLLVEALLTNYRTLSSPSLQHSASCCAIHYNVEFCTATFILKESECVCCANRLNCKQVEHFMVDWKAQWCKSFPHLVLNLSSPSAVINPVPPRRKEEIRDENTVNPTSVWAPCALWISNMSTATCLWWLQTSDF